MRIPEAWEEKWKRFLYEDVSAAAIDAIELEKVFNYFHISSQKLSSADTFEFTPRVPRYPFTDMQGHIIEDDFTKRISVAPSVELAIDATDGGFGLAEEGWLHLYGGIGQPDVKAKQDDCPEDNLGKYGENFRLLKWLEKKLLSGELEVEDAIKLGLSIPVELLPANLKKYKPKSRRLGPLNLPPDLKQEFEQCVPDANDSKEEWLLRPTNLIYIGEVNTDTAEVILSTAALQIVKKAGVETYAY